MADFLPGDAIDFDADEQSVERKRKLLQSLMALPATESTYHGKFYVPNYGAAQKGLQDAIGMIGQGDLDTQAKDISQRRAAFAENELRKYGQLDKPAVPEVVGTGPIAPPPGTPGVEEPTLQSSAPAEGQVGPPEPIPQEAGWLGRGGMVPQGVEFTPNKAGQAMIPGSMSDKLSTLARVAQGGPMYAKFADKLMTQVAEGPEKEAARKAAADDRAALAREAATERAREAELKRIENARLDEHRRADRELEKEKDRIAAKERADQAAADRIAFVQATRGAGGSGGGTFSPAGSTLEGNPVHINTKTLEQVEMRNGVPVAYTGPVVGKGEEKEVKAAMDLANDARYAESLATAINADKKTFSPQANFGSSVSSWLGGLGKEQLTGLTPEQLGLRGVIGRDFAETTKQLYGASFSQSEQKRANGFTPQPNDSAELVVEKLNGAAKFSREMAQKYGTKIQQAAAARAGGATPPAGKTVVKEVMVNGVMHHKYSDGSED